MNLRIERKQNPSNEEREAILVPLRAYNASKSASPPPEHIALLIRDDNNEIVGGVYARLFYHGCSSTYWPCRNRPVDRAWACS